MSSKKEEKSQAAAEKIKAQALSAAKGLSRAQAERAATAAARNVNAYGQKEEGPSRWQERKEAKRQMYLMSTEKAVRLGERKDLKASSSAAGTGSHQCQKCLQHGHWTYECKNERVYVTRPSRSQQLKNPARIKLVVSFEGNADVQKRLEEEEKERRAKMDSSKSSKSQKEESSRKNSKRKHRSKSESGSDTSEASVFESGSSQSESESDYSSEESSSTYSSSDSEDRRRRRKKKPQKKRRHRRYSSSDSSESESVSDSDSDNDRDSRKKNKRRSKKR